jgi:hypothetical protein
MISKRQQSEIHFTEYLSKFDSKKIKDINSLNELFMAEIIIKNS